MLLKGFDFVGGGIAAAVAVVAADAAAVVVGDSAAEAVEDAIVWLRL